MNENKQALDLTIIGAGMIVNDLLLPAALQMRREGVIGHITVVDMRSSAVAALRDSESIKRCFPDQSFDTCPAPGEPDSTDPELYKKVLARQKPYQMVIIALPLPCAQRGAGVQSACPLRQTSGAEIRTGYGNRADRTGKRMFRRCGVPQAFRPPQPYRPENLP